MAQLTRARDRTMHSIVATIQAEQDKAIRAPSKGVVSITGGPGTGKTVVALHRAAFLLYSDRRRYETGGVLVVGPSGVFMRYIERVLPSLGETAVALRSLGEVVDGIRVVAARRAGGRGGEGVGADGRADASYGATGGAGRAHASSGCSTATTTSSRPARARRDPPAAAGQGKRNRQVPRVASTLIDAMWRQVRGERGRDRGRDEFDDDAARHAAFVEFALAWWPPLDATDVLGWLRDPEVLARVGEGVLATRTRRCCPVVGPVASRRE